MQPDGRYIITNISSRLFLYLTKRNDVAITTDINRAYRWAMKSKAENVLKCLPESITRKGEWLVRDTLSDSVPVSDGVLDKVPDKFTADNNNASEDTSSETLSICSVIDSLLSVGSDMKTYVTSLQRRRSSLYERLSVKDKEKEDICHFIEFNELDACKGFKIYKMLHEKLNERRKIKNELQQIDVLLKFLTPELCSAVDRLNCKKYFPKALPELFEKGCDIYKY